MVHTCDLRNFTLRSRQNRIAPTHLGIFWISGNTLQRCARIRLVPNRPQERAGADICESFSLICQRQVLDGRVQVGLVEAVHYGGSADCLFYSSIASYAQSPLGSSAAAKQADTNEISTIQAALQQSAAAAAAESTTFTGTELEALPISGGGWKNLVVEAPADLNLR